METKFSVYCAIFKSMTDDPKKLKLIAVGNKFFTIYIIYTLTKYTAPITRHF